MEKERDYEEIFQKVMDYEQALHEKNLTRIKIGLKCIWIVPLIFLVLLFFTGSNNGDFSDFMDCVLICHFHLSDYRGIYGL